MGECEFCEIIEGEQDAHVIYEDEPTIAFLDAEPAIRGHTLVAPTTHHESIFRDDSALSDPIFDTVEAVALAIGEVLDPDGFSLFHTTGTLVGPITHAHVHLLPRYETDSIHLSLPREPITEAEATHLAEQLSLEVELEQRDLEADFDWG